MGDRIERSELGGARGECGGGRRGVYWVLVGEPEGKRPLGRPKHIWEDSIKMNLQEVGRGLWTGPSWLRIGTGGGHL